VRRLSAKQDNILGTRLSLHRYACVAALQLIRVKCMNEEFELLIEALRVIDGRIRATEVSQQLMAAHLADSQPEVAENIAKTMESIACSEQIETAPEVRDYLLVMAKHLSGNQDADIQGLLKAVPAKEPIPWLKGVIDGGKNA